MTPKNFAVVACRLLAVWFFVQAARDFASSLAKAASHSNLGPPPIIGYPSITQIILPSLVSMLVELSAAVILWLGAFVFAENMTRGTEKIINHEDRIGIGGWQAVGFSLVGLFNCIQGATFVLGNIRWMISPESFYDRFGSEEKWLHIATAIAQLLIGLALLFYAQKTIRVLDYLQRGGRDEISSSSSLDDDAAS